MNFLHHMLKQHKQNVIAIISVIILIAIYLSSQSRASFAPGTELDPNCEPGDVGCVVTAGGGGIGEENATNYNISIGTNTNDVDLGGTGNTTLGYQSLFQNTVGINNTAIGRAALQSSDADNNTGIGFLALGGNTSGSNNTAIGRGALSLNTIGSNNTAIGYGANVNGDLDYATAIGAGATVNQSNSVVIGTNTTNVGIGTLSPDRKLQVVGSVGLGEPSSVAGELDFYNATNNNFIYFTSPAVSSTYGLTLPTAQGGANTFLKNDGSGNLSWAVGGGGGSQWSDSGSDIYFNSGNVGIGTATPGNLLDIDKDQDAPTGISLHNGDSGSSATALLSISAQNALLSIGSVSSSFPLPLVADNSLVFESTNKLLLGATSGITFSNDLSTEQMTFTPGGNLGIGTTSPGAKLHVTDGTIQIDGTGAPTTGGALCLNSSAQISKCTSAVDGSGNCTCP